MKIPNKDTSLALFHINACSLYKSFNQFEQLLRCTNKSFDVIPISETRITKNIFLTNNLAMNDFVFFYLTPIESSAGGTHFYVANHLAYKHHLDLNIYKSNEMEFTFIEILNPKNYNNYNPTNEFLDSFASNSFDLYILQPTRLTSLSKTLIYNIFSTMISPEVISHNLTSIISDHLPQFMIVPNDFSNPL